MARFIENVRSNGLILRRLVKLKKQIFGLELLLTGDSQFDQEVWSNLADNANHLRNQLSLGCYELLIPQNIKTAKELLIEQGESYRRLQLSGLFPIDKVEAFVAMARYGLIRFYFAFIILQCLSKKLVSVSIKKQEQSYKCLFEYFNMNSFNHNLPQIRNFGSSDNKNKLLVSGYRKFDSYIDVCMETVVKFLSDRLYLDQATIRKLKNLMFMLLKFSNYEDKMPADNLGLFYVFEGKLINLMNANAICLTNNIPVAAVGNGGDTLTFSTNQFLEFYRREMLKLFYDMTHIDQARLRVQIGNNSLLKLLNRFPISVYH